MPDASVALCEHCHQIFSSQSVTGPSDLDFGTLFPDVPESDRHSVSIISKLQPSRCTICAMILSHHSEVLRKEIGGRFDHLRIRVSIGLGSHVSHRTLHFSMSYTNDLRAYSRLFYIWMIPLDDGMWLAVIKHQHSPMVCKLTSNHTEAVQPPRWVAEPPRATLNPRSLAFLQQKLSDCCRNHTRCNARAFGSNLQVPRRLLQIHNSPLPTVQLVEYLPIPKSASYTTLSHCWGNVQPLRLMAASEDELRSGIPLEKLPRTFRDAVVVTQSLSVSYIWIDSLCIFQDDLHDWEVEATAMRGVYANAICNIAATAAKDSSIGLSCERNSIRESPFSVEVDWHPEDGSSDEHILPKISRSLVGRYLVFPRAQWAEDVEGGVLNARAWVVQERLLSRRILHFTASQVFWECCEGLSSDIFPDSYPRSLFPRKRYYLHHDVQDFKDSLSSYLYSSSLSDTSVARNEKHVDESQIRRELVRQTNEAQVTIRHARVNRPIGRGDLKLSEITQGQENLNSQEVLHACWQSLVMAYSGCKLSVESDKLVAIAAVSGTLSEALKVTFVAGLWRDHLIQDLLWARNSDPDPSESPFPKRWRAPTWSWAHSNCQVRPWYPQIDADIERTRATVEHIDVDSSPSGQLKHASLRLRGNVLRASVLAGQYAFRLTCDSGPAINDRYSSTILDDPRMERCEQRGLTCMALIEGYYGDEEEMASQEDYEKSKRLDILILQPSQSQPGFYERIGVSQAWYSLADWYKEHEENEERSITII